MNKFKADYHIIFRKYLIKPLVLALCAAAMITFLPGSVENISAATKLTDSKVKNFEDQLARIEKEMNSLKSQIATSKKNIETAIEDKQDLDNEIKLMLDKIEIQNSLVAELASSIDETAGLIAGKQTDYESKYQLFKERLRITYEDGSASYIEMLFGSETLTDFLSRIDRIGAMLEYDTKIMNELKDEKNYLEETKTVLENKKLTQENYIAQLKIDEAILIKKSEEAESYIKKLQSSTATYESLEAKNEKMRLELEADLKTYLKDLEAQQTAKYVGGTFLWPVPTTHTYVSSECGWRTSPITGKREYHSGIDIPAPFGTDVYASNSGTVIKSTYHYSYGNYIMIDHGGGYVTLYAHNSKLLVSVDDKVTKGQVIAKIGSTGDSNGNHCHFTIYKGGNIINPREYFPA